MTAEKSNKRLTPTELVLLISITIVLIAIAIPSLIEPRTVPYYYPRIKSNFRTMRAALEYYYLDHNNSYPVMVAVNEMTEYSTKHSESGYPNYYAIIPGTDSLHGIIKPVEYLRNYLIDDVTGLPYAYYLHQNRYILYAPGNDMTFNITDPEYILKGETEEEIIKRLSPHTYDPTNGTWSSGDIWRIGGVGIEME